MIERSAEEKREESEEEEKKHNIIRCRQGEGCLLFSLIILSHVSQTLVLCITILTSTPTANVRF